MCTNIMYDQGGKMLFFHFYNVMPSNLEPPCCLPWAFIIFALFAFSNSVSDYGVQSSSPANSLPEASLNI